MPTSGEAVETSPLAALGGLRHEEKAREDEVHPVWGGLLALASGFQHENNACDDYE